MNLAQINQSIQVKNMWDGFWIYDYYQGKLTISGSFDRTIYRNVDIFFRGVSFFNLPSEWRDTDIPTYELLRLASREEFKLQFPDFEIGDKQVFAIDLKTRPDKAMHSFFVVADNIEAEQCHPNDSSPRVDYTDPLKAEAFPCLKNRIPYL